MLELKSIVIQNIMNNIVIAELYYQCESVPINYYSILIIL